VSTHEDLRVVLVQSTLVVSNSWHVLDDNAVIWVLTFLVEDIVGSDHVIYNIGLGDLLGAELPLGRQVLAVVIAEMVIGCDGGKLDTSANEEINESRLHFGLAGFEVVTSNESLVLVGEFDATWDEGVLGRTVDEWSAFENTGNSKDGGWRNLFVSALDGLDEVVGSVVDTNDEIGETLGIGSPLNDNLLEVVGSLEVTLRC
jgi:hypothetical protein